MMTYILCSRVAGCSTAPPSLASLCGLPTCVLVLPPAGDIGREQLSEAVIGYNDLERAKVSTGGAAARTATATLPFACSWAHGTDMLLCWRVACHVS